MSLLLLDTHLLLWVASNPARLSPQAHALMVDPTNILAFSAASLWEVVIQAGLGRDDVFVGPRRLRRGLLAAGYNELPILGEHAIAVGRLPPLHRDPFDRILIAQAETEGATLLTVDQVVARYPGPVRFVG